MKKFFCSTLLSVFFLLISINSVSASTIWANGVSGSTGWFDAEKDNVTSDDNELCWAASAANILAWSGWDAGYANEDTIFDFLTVEDPIDVGGWQNYGWNFWFDGTQNPGGYGHYVGSSHGGFYTTAEYNAALDQDWLNDATSLATAQTWLENDYGVGIAIDSTPDVGGGMYHAVTLWGIDIDDANGDYLGVWITDSDNDKGGPDDRPDSLNYYDVSFSAGYWWLDYGAGAAITEMDALKRNPIPEPATMILFGLGLLGLSGVSRRKQ